MAEEKEYRNIFDDIAKQNQGERQLSPQLQQEVAPVQAATLDSLPEVPKGEETPEPVKEAAPVKEEMPPKNTEERNLVALRLARERAEKERDELAQQLAKAYQQMPQYQQQQSDPNPDDLVEWKHVDKRIKDLESQLKGWQQQSNETIIESRLKAQYPDFDKVVSRDNIDILKIEYPELADTLNSSSNLYSKAVSAYTLIKKLGIHKDESAYEMDRARALKNSAKPKPLASISPQQADSPLSRANAFADGLTDELKAQLRKEMFAAMRNK